MMPMLMVFCYTAVKCEIKAVLHPLSFENKGMVSLAELGGQFTVLFPQDIDGTHVLCVWKGNCWIIWTPDKCG